jgi:hypothetical protein
MSMKMASSSAAAGRRIDISAPRASCSVVTDHEVARRILEAIPLTARAPPPSGTAVVREVALA